MSVPQVSTTTAPTTSSSKTLGRAATTTWAYKPSCQIYVVGARTWTVPTCRRASRPWTQPTNSQPSLWVLSCSDLDTRGRVAPSVALNSVPVAPNEERTWTRSPQTGNGEEVDLPLQVAQWSWLRGQLVPHTTIALNKNLAARLQRDNGHEGPSVGTALGFFTGGELRYWPGNGDEVQCWFKLYLPRESNKNMITMGKPPAVDMKEHFVAVSCMLGCGLLLLHAGILLSVRCGATMRLPPSPPLFISCGVYYYYWDGAGGGTTSRSAGRGQPSTTGIVSPRPGSPQNSPVARRAPGSISGPSTEPKWSSFQSSRTGSAPSRLQSSVSHRRHRYHAFLTTVYQRLASYWLACEAREEAGQ